MKVSAYKSARAAFAATLLVIGSASPLWSAPTGLLDKLPNAPVRSGAAAKVDGFRSAKFGMSAEQVTKAILKDFRIPRKMIKVEIHPTERTQNYLIDVNNLIPDSGKARIAYIFGYKSRKLSQVNILWNNLDHSQGKSQGPVATANLLRILFLKKGFQKDKFVANRRLKDGSIIVFRGKDSQGRMVLLFLNNPVGTPEQAKKRTVKEKAELAKKMTLLLSYLKNPSQPDVFSLKDRDF